MRSGPLRLRHRPSFDFPGARRWPSGKKITLVIGWGVAIVGRFLGRNQASKGPHRVLINNGLNADWLAQAAALGAGEKRWLGQVQGLGTVLLLTALAQAGTGLVLMVAQDSAEAARLEDELRFCGIEPVLFPDWEILPYDRLSPHQDIVSERLAVLAQVPTSGVLVVAASTLMQRIAPPSWLLGQHFDWQKGQRFDVERERSRLVRAGYHAVETVYAPGEFALRGSLLDVFPMGQAHPVRVELFDDEIESLRQFDPETQRTLPDGRMDAFRLLPAREFPLVDGRAVFRERFAEVFPEHSPKRFYLYQDVMEGLAAPGLEYYLPLFFEAQAMQSGTLLDYLPVQTRVVSDAAVQEALAHFWAEISQRHEDRRHNVDAPILPPSQLFLPEAELLGRLNGFGRILISQAPAPNRAGAQDMALLPPPALPVNHRAPEPLAPLLRFLQDFAGRVLLVAESAGRRESLRDLLHERLGVLPDAADLPDFVKNSPHRLAIATAPIERGVLASDALAVVVESQLFDQRVVQARRRKATREVSGEFLIRSLAELAIGAPVVHVDHGVGRYQGLVTLEIDDALHEFLQIDYAEGAKVYVPVASLQLISRYSGGDPEHAPLHKLGSDAWAKAKRKAVEQIHDVAAELLSTQARRQARPGIIFASDGTDYELFASQFAFEETPDQALAIAATLHDMASPKPMDRLMCGDVGFGKTEVAMRAAFVAVSNGHQVAVLVPTTLLAQQHYDNFCDRFADWPVRIEVLSRFGGRKAQQQAIADAAAGKVDILIGTHKLLQDGIVFKKLGLMIVDEEHRFGVRDKEKIKALRADVDLLTLTATPIPRTLNMAFSGMRDLSIISTPPARRLSVKTFVMERSNPVLKEAILRELLRGGQVYLLHNDVDSIDRAAEDIARLVPEARVAVAHGQMRERELEQVMQAFYHKRFNVLVCSTIIETGIDVPNANTIIIERADKLGLAQLHQLRGRVGRSHHQAYAYLLVPSLKGLKGDAEKRLEAIQRASDLGAGFILASEDLEIRGAGELLGEQQSGNMQAIGFSLYMDMLERATKAIANGKAPNLDAPLSLTADINLHLPARIPDDYLNDVHQRLLFYKRISAAESAEALDQIRIEMIDRFGLLPQPARDLFVIHHIRLRAEALGIEHMDIHASGGVIVFAPDTPVEAMTIIGMIQQQPGRFRMEGGQRLKLIGQMEEPAARLAAVQQVLDELSATGNKAKDRQDADASSTVRPAVVSHQSSAKKRR